MVSLHSNGTRAKADTKVEGMLEDGDLWISPQKKSNRSSEFPREAHPESIKKNDSIIFLEHRQN